MEAWLQLHFPSMLDGSVIVYTDGLDFVTYDPSHVGTEFPNITAPPTYSALCALPIVDDGWQRIFEQWKAKGLLIS